MPSTRYAAVLCAVLACSCGVTEPRGYLSGTWNGFDVVTTIQFTIDRAELRGFTITPAPFGGFSWHCPDATPANGINAALQVVIVDDSVAAVLPGPNYTATVELRFYQVNATLEARGSLSLSGTACTNGPVVVPFTARHVGE
jgi:hypothetical protein